MTNKEYVYDLTLDEALQKLDYLLYDRNCDFRVIQARQQLIDVIRKETNKLKQDLEVLDKSCLTDKQMYDYLKGKNGYAIHIKYFHIFDKPRELCDFTSFTDLGKPMTKAPQNMCNVCDDLDHNCERYILISIRPEWACKILNGEKIIEVRKKVLKEMI